MNKYQIKGCLLKAVPTDTDHKTIGRIWVNGTEVLPEMARALRPFYECGFEWGRGAGNQAYTAALAICLSIFPEERLAENLFVCFKEEFVQYFPAGDFDVLIDLAHLMLKYQLRLQPDLYSFFCFSSLLNSREILMHKNKLTGEFRADLSENYTMHNQMIADERLRRLNERKQRLIFRFFKRENCIVTGHDIQEVMHKVEDIMSSFFWKSLGRVLRSQYSARCR
jgi:hypothetical protein